MMNEKTRNTLLGVAGAMLSAAAIGEGISMAIDRNMVGEALDREEPKTMQRLKSRMKGYAGDPAELEEYRKLVKQLAESPHETVHIVSYDDTPLTGHLFRVENAKRVILAMHGWRSGWAKDFAMVADFFRQNDCTVLYAEQRGQGESGGEYMGFGMVERFDCLEWVRWLNANGFAEMPIYLSGISMGASTVLMAAGFEELPENVVGITADCGFTSAKAIWKHISENNLRLPYCRREKHVDILCRKRLDMDSDAYTTLDAMAVCKTPIFFIHGEADTFVPVEMTMENYEACQAPKKLLIVPEANHGLSYVYDREGYEAAIKAFWQEREEEWSSSSLGKSG